MKKTAIFLFTAVLLVMMSYSSFAQDKEKSHKHSHECSDSTHWMHGMKIEHHGDDTLVVYINKNHMDPFDMHHMHGWWKKNKYNGHWAGVDLGINGFVNNKFTTDFGPEYGFLDQNTARSLVVNLNPFELNVNIARKHFGFTTGLGFQMSNYYFTKSYVITGDSAKLTANRIEDAFGNLVSFKRSKLFVAYLNVPLLFEYQTNRYCRLNSFHVTAGVIGGVRIGTYTKEVYESWNQNYYLLNDNGNRIGEYYQAQNFDRDHGAFHLQTFKADVTLRIGWSFLNVWGTYALVPMFKDGQGPKVYPWSVGITLLGW